MHFKGYLLFVEWILLYRYTTVVTHVLIDILVYFTLCTIINRSVVNICVQEYNMLSFIVNKYLGIELLYHV